MIAAASQEIRSSIVYSTMIIVLVFVPLFALSGIEGRLFAPLGIAYIVSILASLIVVDHADPGSCSLPVAPDAEAARKRESIVVRWLKRQHAAPRMGARRPVPVLASIAAAVVVARRWRRPCRGLSCRRSTRARDHRHAARSRHLAGRIEPHRSNRGAHAAERAGSDPSGRRTGRSESTSTPMASMSATSKLP